MIEDVVTNLLRVKFAVIRARLTFESYPDHPHTPTIVRESLDRALLLLDETTGPTIGVMPTTHARMRKGSILPVSNKTEYIFDGETAADVSKITRKETIENMDKFIAMIGVASENGKIDRELAVGMQAFLSAVNRYLRNIPKP